MSASRLRRTYLLRGLDRVLYSRQPRWQVGTFEQVQTGEGRLILQSGVLSSAAELEEGKRAADRVAEQFRLAIAKRIGCPLFLTLEKSEEPSFDQLGMVRAHDEISASDQIKTSLHPQLPPDEIEQIPEEAARWILTLTEARTFDGYPDEVMKRLYLLIEELKDSHMDCLDEEDRAALQELRWVRDFVSHSKCNKKGVCEFIAAVLPNAVISTSPLEVQFDRTSLEHRNFVGRFDPRARKIVSKLLDAAIAGLAEPA